METDLRYSVSPRIVFETAVAKACLPQSDTDVLALSLRVKALEQQLEKGVPVQAAAPVLSEETEEDPFARPAPARRAEPVRAAAPRPQAPARSEGQSALDSRDKAGALFLRSLRKTSRSGVLFTMCQDLEPSFEGDTFVLSTESEVICSRLNSTENLKAVQAALEAIGISDFKIVLKGQQKDPMEEDIEQLKRDFPDTEFRIK